MYADGNGDQPAWRSGLGPLMRGRQTSQEVKGLWASLPGFEREKKYVRIALDRLR